MKNKFEALLSRKIIGDAFDIEFLLMKGIELPANRVKLERTLQIINNFNEQDYKFVLRSVFDEKDRIFYLPNKFKLLKEEIIKKINFLK